MLASRNKGRKRVKGRATEMQKEVSSPDPADAAESTTEDPEVMMQISPRGRLTRRSAALLSGPEERPSGSCDSSIGRAFAQSDDKTENVGNKERTGKRKCSKRLDMVVKKTKQPEKRRLEAADVSAAVSAEPVELPSRPVRAGLCRGAVVRILSDPVLRGMTGFLGDYDRSADSWQVSGDFDLGSKWIPASNLAFFVGKPGK